MTVMHVDANSAYLSWTAVDLLEKGYPLDIRTVPAAIAGIRKTGTALFWQKSIPAKKYKIGTGESLYESKQRCPELLLFPPNYDLYLSCSNAMYSILQEYSPVIQRYSVDECFVDFDHCEKAIWQTRGGGLLKSRTNQKGIGFHGKRGCGQQ